MSHTNTHGTIRGNAAHSARSGSDYMVCPRCWEVLTRSDVEGFGHCPYCDHRFEFDAKMEDFLLQPLVREWTRQSHAFLDDLI
ncbi:MAG: hypothetical protein ACOCWJ_06250 [Verrucomicrobiota bacterium]